MKILYVKHNSERNKEFQLKTIIYEENGIKYVKKEAICDEAIVHLKNMKLNAQKLTNSIIDTHVKVAKIIDETDRSLTFEYIEGISFEHKYNNAKKIGKEAAIMTEYMSFLQTAFKMTNFNSDTMVTPEFKKLFGDINYTQFHEDSCFKDISNIDLLLSNIIFKDNDIFIIDYEWVYNLQIPLEFVFYRTFHNENSLYKKMEEYFIHNTVAKQNAFFTIQNRYNQNRHVSVLENIDKQTQTIKKLHHDINHLILRTQELTLKGRTKTILKFIFPIKILQELKSLKNNLLS